MPRSRHQIARVAPKGARTAADGTVFDSLSELRRWEALRATERAGGIRNLRRQVKFDLVLPPGLDRPVPVKIRSAGYPNGRNCVYTADFVYDEDGVSVVEEWKGVDDPTSRLRRAVVEAGYGIRIRLTGPAAEKQKKKDGIALNSMAHPKGPGVGRGRGTLHKAALETIEIELADPLSSKPPSLLRFRQKRTRP